MRKLALSDFDAAEIIYKFFDCFDEHYSRLFEINAQEHPFGTDLSMAEYIQQFAFDEFKEYAKTYWNTIIYE